MPASPNCPEPLRTRLGKMESAVQSTKRSLAFAAPEMQDAHWARLQESLADIIANAYALTHEERDAILDLVNWRLSESMLGDDLRDVLTSAREKLA